MILKPFFPHNLDLNFYAHTATNSFGYFYRKPGLRQSFNRSFDIKSYYMLRLKISTNPTRTFNFSKCRAVPNLKNIYVANIVKP